MFLHLWWKVAKFKRKEEGEVRRRFYSNPFLRKLDKALKQAYFWQNPYRLSRLFWNAHVYGETPLTSLEVIGNKAQLSSKDCFVDLGVGRGRGLFFVHAHFQCSVLGIECIPTFIEKAKNIQKNMNLKGVEFLQADLTELSSLAFPSPRGYTVFYLAWTCFKPDLIEKIIHHLEQLPIKMKVITVSEPIDSPYFVLTDQFEILFPWGNGEIFIYEKKSLLSIS